VTLLRFTRGYRLWNSGETAGFPDDVARSLLAAGVAVPVGGVVLPPAEHAPEVPAEVAGAEAAPAEVPAEPDMPVRRARAARE
jgi:hypothetical protein